MNLKEDLRVQPYERLRFHVSSFTDSKRSPYLVDFSKVDGGCECPDYQIRHKKRGTMCKHCKAVLIWLGQQVIEELRTKEKPPYRHD